MDWEHMMISCVRGVCSVGEGLLLFLLLVIGIAPVKESKWVSHGNTERVLRKARSTCSGESRECAAGGLQNRNSTIVVMA